MAAAQSRKVAKTPKPASASAPVPASNTASVLPRWLLILGALVPVVGLLWTVASHFIPKTEADKPAASPTPAASAQPAAALPNISVSVSGAGNVGVGVNNGSIHNGGAKP